MHIPDRRIRRWVTIGVFFAISLLIGRVLETVLDKKTLVGLHTAQQGWISEVEAFTPFGLVGGYMDDLQAVMSGEWTHQPPPEVSTEAFAERMAQRAACSEARLSLAARPACGAELMIAGGSAAACAVNESRLGCAEYHACLDRSGSSALLSTPLECIGVDLSSPILSTGFTPEALMTPQANASAPFPLFVPLVALWHGATRLASGGAGALVMAGLQIAFGLAAFLLVTSGMSKANEPGFGSALANITLGPLAVIALGSVLALVLQLIMLAALYGLSWVTGFAAWAAGATGIAGGCWWCFTKVAEKGVEHSVSR